MEAFTVLAQTCVSHHSQININMRKQKNWPSKLCDLNLIQMGCEQC